MKNTMLMFFTTIILTGASFASAGNGDVGSVDEGREAAEFLSKVEMDEYFIRAEDVKSVDIFVDYEMIEVDCHGVPTIYKATETQGSQSTLVEKHYLLKKAICVLQARDQPKGSSGSTFI